MTKANRLTWEAAARLLLDTLDAPPHRQDAARAVLHEGLMLAEGSAAEGMSQVPGRVARATVEAARDVLRYGPAAAGPHGRP